MDKYALWKILISSGVLSVSFWEVFGSAGFARRFRDKALARVRTAEGGGSLRHILGVWKGWEG